MNTLNTIIEEEKKFDEKFYEGDRNSVYCKKHKVYATPTEIKSFLTTAMQRAYEAGKASWLRSEIEKLEGMKQTNVYHTLHCIKGLAENHEHCVRNLTGAESGRNAAITSIITRYKEELKVLESNV